MTTKSKKKDIRFGNVALPDDEFLAKNVKVRVTTLIDQDVLEMLRAYAKKKNVKYQTALNALLRTFFKKPNSKVQELSEERVRRIVREELKKRA